MLSKEFIEKQHGSLEIESEMGKGTKVTLRIPKEKKQYYKLQHIKTIPALIKFLW
jgi:signal transduction histidine kinase